MRGATNSALLNLLAFSVMLSLQGDCRSIIKLHLMGNTYSLNVSNVELESGKFFLVQFADFTLLCSRQISILNNFNVFIKPASGLFVGESQACMFVLFFNVLGKEI